MPRILLATADPSLAEGLQHALGARGLDVVTANDKDEALAWARTGGIDLVVSDIQLRETDGSALRTEVRRCTSPYPVPFIFLSTEKEATAPWAQDLSKQEHIFLKPAPEPEFLRTVQALLTAAHRQEGTLGGRSLDALLARVESNSESGVLISFRDETIKKIVFHEGRIAYCGSNDPRELVGQAFIRAGLISESDLRQAMTLQEENHELLGKVLQALAKVTPEQAEQTIDRKFRESVLELYLWPSGKWVYYGGSVEVLASGSPLRIPLSEIRAEGAKRATQWASIQPLIPPEATSFEVVDSAFPPGFPESAGDKKLIEMCRRGYALRQIRLELRDQDFAVHVRLARFLQSGLLRPRDAQAAAAPAADDNTLQLLLVQAVHALESGRGAIAKEKFQAILAIDPSHALARKRLAELAGQAKGAAAAKGLSDAARVRLMIPPQSLPSLDLPATDLFVLSRVPEDGLRVKDLLHICPMTEAEVLAILERRLADSIIALM